MNMRLDLLEIATKSREGYASEVFNTTNIEHAIKQRAEFGFRTYRIIQDYPFELFETIAAKQLEQWLDDNDLCFVWHPTKRLADPPNSISCSELEINW